MGKAVFRILLALGLVWFANPAPVSAQEEPSEVFLQAYQSFQAAEKLEGESAPQRALLKYREALSLLEQLCSSSPDWQPLVVEYRTRRTRENIARLETITANMPPLSEELEGPLPTDDQQPGRAAVPRVTTAPPGPRSSRSPVLAVPTEAAPAPSGRLAEELSALRKQLAAARRENERLTRRAEKAEAELKSALTEVDRTKVNVVELKAQLAQVTDALENLKKDKSEFTAMRREREKETAAFLRKLAEAEADNEVLREENESLLAKLERAASHIASSETIREQLLKERSQLAAARTETQQKLEKAQAETSRAKQEIAKLKDSNAGLEKQLAEVKTSGGLKKEFERLAQANKELTEKLAAAEKRMRQSGANVAATEAIQSELNSISDRLLAAQAEISQKEETIKSLTAQLDEVSGELARLKLLPMPTGEEQRLLAENDLLRGIILRQIRTQNRRDEAKRAVEEELARLKVRSETLAAQIAVLSEPVLELTAEENALFKDPVTLLADSSPDRVNVDIAMAQPTAEEAEQNLRSQAPQGASELDDELRAMVRHAQEFFNNREFLEAERIYQRIVERAPENYFALANLGAVQIEAGKLAAAEVALEKAISLSPNDAFAHTHLGIVRSRQGRFAEAKASLARAIEINPADPVPHNYLAICLAQQGDREAAEASLKRSIELDSNYANAHFNLAVLYATTKPPSLELAKRHYQQATALGAAPDASLERLIQ